MKYFISILILFFVLSASAQNNGIIVLKYFRSSGEAGKILYPLAPTAINNDSILPKSRIAALISGTGAVTSVSGTADRITSTGGATPVIDISSTFEGLLLKKADNLTGLGSTATSRSNLGATTLGSNIFTITNPSAVTFPRFNADNTINALNASDFRTAIGAGTGNGDALTTNPLSQFAATTSAQLAGVISDETGSGALVFGTSPSFTTPVLGAATATSLNGNIFTTGTYTLTGAAAKTLTFNNSLTLAGTDATTMTFPTTSATLARTDAANSFTGTNTFQNIASLTNNTYDIGATGNVFNTVWANTFRANTSNALNLRTGGTGQEMVFALGTTTTMMKMMATTGNIIMQNGGTFTDVTADRLQVSGNINLTAAGNKIKIATGSNASVGTATLVSGTVTVNTTAVTANSIIFITVNTPGGTLGPTYTAPSGSITPGTSFVINAVGTTGVVTATDTSTVNWWIVN